MTSATKRKWRESFEAYLYLLPSMAILAAFWFIPIVISLAMSFGDVTALQPVNEMTFVGLRQYEEALRSRVFIQTLWNTTNYVIYSVPATLVIALAIALLMNSQIRARGAFRTIFFIPYITTWVAISIVFRYLFDREAGLGNWIIGVVYTDLLGIANPPRLDWLSEPRGIFEILLWNPLSVRIGSMPWGFENLVRGPSLSLFCIIVTSVWRDIGYFMVIFLAGLQNIDKSLYEAAAIDGANRPQQFRAITFPLLSPVTFFLLIISMIGAFKVFVPQFMMTPTGGPDKTTMPIVMLLYEEGFKGEWKLSYAAALAYILTMIILLLTLVQNKLFGKRVEYGN